MKQWIMRLILIVFFGSISNANAQSQEARQLLLDVEKLAQLKNILTNLKKGYEVVSGGYTTIKNISEGNFNLHNTFLNSLLEINPIVKNYSRIAKIIATQVSIVKEYKSAFRDFSGSDLFNPGEIDYLAKVYKNLFNQSVKNLDALITVVTANKIRMSDDERLSSIDDIWKEAQNEILFLRHFNNSNRILAVQRSKDRKDNKVMNQLYDINQ